jgi:hypothetical protein
MHPGTPQVMLGLFSLVGGILIVKVFGNDWGFLVFLLGIVLAVRGGIDLASSGAKEIGN